MRRFPPAPAHIAALALAAAGLTTLTACNAPGVNQPTEPQPATSAAAAPTTEATTTTAAVNTTATATTANTGDLCGTVAAIDGAPVDVVAAQDGTTCDVALYVASVYMDVTAQGLTEGSARMWDSPVGWSCLTVGGEISCAASNIEGVPAFEGSGAVILVNPHR